MAETAHCSICLGMGSIDTDTGHPWEPGRRPGAKVDCETCQGFGQFTDCPLCRGAGCLDCDGGMVAGPHHPDALAVNAHHAEAVAAMAEMPTVTAVTHAA